jgi:hypothetical protein
MLASASKSGISGRPNSWVVVAARADQQEANRPAAHKKSRRRNMGIIK